MPNGPAPGPDALPGPAPFPLPASPLPAPLSDPRGDPAFVPPPGDVGPGAIVSESVSGDCLFWLAVGAGGVGVVGAGGVTLAGLGSDASFCGDVTFIVRAATTTG